MKKLKISPSTLKQIESLDKIVGGEPTSPPVFTLKNCTCPIEITPPVMPQDNTCGGGGLAKGCS